ncbi:hypothetical protein BCR43DRAFT_221718 [Syncephalastrum racemosum]|uniref:Uncharacterized protein n=1 Tax=Syncephalastrum racemosum TaxID=13706 RepID=A0A1X2HKR8_SYNRA|nr:hypothetical protein BCR43DRAFT_221718 [Syncephalastrum racemosum]
MELNCVPNFRLAEFGFSNRFKVNVFFPHLRASNGKFGHRMSLTEVGVFVDRVFLAALKVVAPSYVVNNFGVRYAAEVERYRNDQGQVRPKATSLVPFYVAPLQQTMRELVDGSPDLSGYRDFFFDCRAIGIKGYGPVDAYQEFLGDIAWDLVDPSNVYVDYGIEVCSQGGEKVVGLLAKEGHHDLARLIFGQSYTSNNSIYR